MNGSVAIEPHHHRTWRVHRTVLLVLAVLAGVLTALLWFHPTLGYAEPGSVIAGADLRGDLTTILWVLFAVVAVVTTLGLVAATRLTQHRLAPLLVVYAIAFGVVPLAMIVVDRYI